MPKLPPAFANALWYLSCLREARALRRALSDVAGTQQRLLLATLKRNEDTEYGHRHGFAAVRSANEYRERAPLTDYGIYRYQMGDVVEVTGRFEACPLLRFLGKEDLVSDRYGEKLNERHAREALRGALARHAPEALFAMLAFEEESRGYTLFIEAKGLQETALLSLADHIEGELRANHHYRYCRDLGQLEHLQVFRVRHAAAETYQAVCRSGGQRAGDVKPAALHLMSDWSRRFEGRFLGSALATYSL